MTAKEKAEQLRNKFSDALYEGNGTSAGAIACAIITVDEILNIITYGTAKRYWQQVKHELENNF